MRLGTIDATFFDIGRLDQLAQLQTPMHRLDPRAKVLTTMAFLMAVVSFPKYEVAGLLPFLLYPVMFATVGQLPLGLILRKIVVVAPFAIMVGILNPFFDREIILRFGMLEVSGGWVSFASIMLRFCLTIGIALLLIATTSFQGLCFALFRLGLPKILTVQLLFLYRYIFVLVGEAMRVVRARSLRSFAGRGLGIRVFASVVGHLLLRTLQRAQRVHLAMLSRGFDGEIRMLRPLHFRGADFVFILGWCTVFAVLRIYNLPHLLGAIVARTMS